MSSHSWEHSRASGFEHRDDLPVRIPYRHLPAQAVIDWHDYNGEPLARLHTQLGHPHIVIPTIAEYLVVCHGQQQEPDPAEFVTFAEILAPHLDSGGTSRQDLPRTTFYYRLVRHADFTTQPADPFRWNEPQRAVQLIAQRRTDGFQLSGSGAPTPWLTIRTLTTLSAVLSDAAEQLRRLAQVRPVITDDTDGPLLERAELIVQASAFRELARKLGPRRW
jgi:hypothetical protein